MAETQSPILVTGAAGFIGFHVAMRLLDRGDQVIGLDNINDYYDVRLKQARLAQLTPHERFVSSSSISPIDKACRIFLPVNRYGAWFISLLRQASATL